MKTKFIYSANYTPAFIPIPFDSYVQLCIWSASLESPNKSKQIRYRYSLLLIFKSRKRVYSGQYGIIYTSQKIIFQIARYYYSEILSNTRTQRETEVIRDSEKMSNLSNPLFIIPVVVYSKGRIRSLTTFVLNSRIHNCSVELLPCTILFNLPFESSVGKHEVVHRGPNCRTASGRCSNWWRLLLMYLKPYTCSN